MTTSIVNKETASHLVGVISPVVPDRNFIGIRLDAFVSKLFFSNSYLNQSVVVTFQYTEWLYAKFLVHDPHRVENSLPPTYLTCYVALVVLRSCSV